MSIKKAGFTLIELLIVVTIIGILASMGLRDYSGTVEKVRSAEAIVNIGAIRIGLERHWYEQKSGSDLYVPATLDTLDIGNPNLAPVRLYDYSLEDKSSFDVRNYYIRAERIGKADKYWLEFRQFDNNTGEFYKSPALIAVR